MYGQDPKNPDAKRFSYHIAASVTIDGAVYVIDPYYSGVNGRGITTFEEWTNKQSPYASELQSAAVDPIQPFYKEYNKNKDINAQEYAGKWLEHFAKTGEYDFDGLE
jgi:hypothetical protein